MSTLSLFQNLEDPSQNLLPYDGEVYHWGVVFERELSDRYFEHLYRDIEWKNDEAIVFGKRIVTPRAVAWYGDKPYEYRYSGITKVAKSWTSGLLEIKNKTEQLTKETYNSCLLNLYHNGSEGMAWHSDGEKDLLRHGAIASVTFGTARKFSFKHKETKEKVDIMLEHGSLLVMKGITQDFWLHRLPPTTKVKDPRINLTFRTIVE